MALAHSPKIVTSGLVMCLDAANPRSYPGSGTAWTDLSFGSNNGTLTNGPTFNSSNGGSIVFDGTNDYISTTFDASWNHTNSVSISLFLKPTSLTSYYPFIGKGPSNWEWQLLQKNSSLEFVYWNTGGGHTNGSTPNITNFFTDLNYVNVFLVWSHLDNSYYFYRNGELVNTTVWVDATINQNRTDGINIGGNLYTWVSNGSFWPGSIGQVLFYNRALNAVEVLQNYNAIRSRFGL